MEYIYLTMIAFLLLQIKHFVIDYVVQMADPDAQKKFNEKEWVKPLLFHSAQHGAATAIVIIFVGLYISPIDHSTDLIGMLALILGLFDTITHFIIDRIKASPKLLREVQENSDYAYWVIMGADQLAHNIVYVIIVSALMYILNIDFML